MLVEVAYFGVVLTVRYIALRLRQRLLRLVVVARLYLVHVAFWRRAWRIILWTVLPVLATFGATLFGLLAAGAGADASDARANGDPELASELAATSDSYRGWAIFAGGALAVLLIAKAFYESQEVKARKDIRYGAVRELHNRLGPALRLMTEAALLDPTETAARREILKNIASHCCSAIVAMVPGVKDVRAVVFELTRPPTGDLIKPLAQFGRMDIPRTFDRGDEQGREVFDFLEAEHPGPERYEDLTKLAPPGFTVDSDRYRTFIRVPIWANGVIFGMLTVDAPKKRALREGDQMLAELIAAELEPAFAVTAG